MLLSAVLCQGMPTAVLISLQLRLSVQDPHNAGSANTHGVGFVKPYLPEDL